MRHAHRTLIARCFAALIVCLAASPLTAPFTTCDISDLTSGNHQSDVPKPGHQVAVPNAKVAPNIDIAPAVAAPTVIAARFDAGRQFSPLTARPQRRSSLQAILRI